MRGSTILDIPLQEQEWMLAKLRHARHDGLLALHVLLLCAAGRTPTEIARIWGQVLKYHFLSCSRCTILLIVG